MTYSSEALVQAIADEIADRLQFAIGDARKVEIEQVLRRVPAFGDEATLRTLVLRIMAEQQRVAPTLTRAHMLATSRHMRAASRVGT